MDFVAVVDQVIALLRQRGRVTYRTLQRQFQLDADALTDLLAELRHAHPDELCEDEQGVVWTGDASTAAALAPPSIPRDQHLERPADLPSPAALPGIAPSTPDAERRQLTVLFCDLVDSTALSSQLDPEELREVVRAYQDTCAKVIARFDGHIAQYLGDGLLVYFGYPLAHEDDAQRAVRAGLGIIEAVGQLNTRLAREREVHLAVRLGVHTGLVVVGEVGGGTRQEQLALGETPNLAARLQGMAMPNTLVISAATFQLLGGFFTYQSLGTSLLKGLAQPIEVYRVLYESMARSRLEAVGSTGLTPLVGREQEVGLVRGEEAVQIAETVDQPFTLSHAYLGIGLVHLRKGDLQQAIAMFERGLGVCQVSDIQLVLPWVASYLGYAYALSGRISEALPLLELAVEQTAAMQQMAYYPLWIVHLSEAHLLDGRIEDASELARRALGLSRDLKQRGHEVYALRLLGEIAASGDPPEAVQAASHYRQALTLAEALDIRPLQAHCHRGLGTLYTKTGRWEQARAALSTAMALYRTMEMTFWMPQTEAALAQGEGR